MQSASSNFTQEASGGQVAWAKPRVFADWDGTGYGATDSIDDLSAQVGDSFTIVHVLDDGLPDDASLATTQDAVTLEVDLVYGRTPGQGVAEGNRLASRYFSPYNGSSPVSGFERDTAPVKLDFGLVTAAGQEHVRLFTGQMINLRTRGQVVQMYAASATRLRLMKLVQFPPINGEDVGLNATWPITYALMQCGLYVAPAPRSGCRLYMSMHGSMRPNIPSGSSLFVDIPLYVLERNAGAPKSTFPRPSFTSDAPYMMALDLYLNASQTHYVNSGSIDLEAGAGIITATENAGRVEFWVRGDTADVANAPIGSGNVTTLAGFTFENHDANTGKVTCGISPTRAVFVTVADGTNTQTLTHSTTLPTDSAWHSVGMAWDIAAGKLWVYLDGVEQSSTVVLTTANLPNAENWKVNTPGLMAFLPVAELHLTAGASANPVTAAWLGDVSFAPDVTMRPSILELMALVEKAPREAWEFIGSLAQAELAQTRVDENDKFNYLPWSYWAEDAQQTVVDNISTELNAQDLDVDLDPSMIRNSVGITYSAVTIGPYWEFFQSGVITEIPPGISDYVLYLDTPTVFAPTGTSLGNMTATDVSTGQPDDALYFFGFVTVNTSSDGSGTYLTQSDVIATVVDWDAGHITIRFQNNTPATCWLANNNSSRWPVISVPSRFVRSPSAAVTGQDAPSIAKRGERALDVSLPMIQRREDAQAIANELAGRLAQPRKVITVNLFGDPRRQPGDLVAVDDSANSGLTGYWRIQRIEHNRDGANYSQKCMLVKAWLVMRWDVSNWDETIWGL